MPFQFDLSQVFWGLMNKTMWDCRFGNMNGFNGFNGGFMNSCWGGGFQVPAWGDSYNFSSTSGGSSSSSTIEDEVEKRGLTRKQNTLYKLLEDYAKSLSEGTERDTLEVALSRHKSVKQGNYDALQALYEENKTKIQKKFNNGTKIEVSAASKTAATDFASTNTDFKSILKVDSEKKTESQLKDGVDAMEFLYSLQTTKKQSFKALYEDAMKNANDTKKDEMKKVLEAVYKDLANTALEVKKDNAVSEDTKASIGKLLEIAATNATQENVDQLYCWIRLAKAEIADSKYASLQEDFPEDPLLGKVNGVASTTAALDAEGLKVDDIKTQTAVIDFSGQTVEQSMKALEANYVTALTKEQLTTLNGIEGVPTGIKAAWVDKNSRFNYQIIRYIDKDGNLKYVRGVGLKDGNIQTIGDAVKEAPSVSPIEIQAQAATLAAVEVAKDTLEEVTVAHTGLPEKYNNVRIFREKVPTGENKYSRAFFVGTDGNLKEIKNVYLSTENKWEKIDPDKDTEDVNADLDEIVQQKQDDAARLKLSISKESVDKGQNVCTMIKSNKFAQLSWVITRKSGYSDYMTTDNICGILCEIRNEYPQEGLMVRLQKCETDYSEGFCSRVPKMLMRKAQEMGPSVTGSQAYHALEVYYGATGTSVCENGVPKEDEDTFTLNKHTGDKELSQSEAKKLDDMIYALLDEMLKYQSEE